MYARLFELSRAQIELVMLGGRPLVTSPQMQPVFSATKTGCESVQVDQTEKLMSQSLVARLRRSVVPESGLILS